MPHIIRRSGSQVQNSRRTKRGKGGRILGTVRSYPYRKRTRGIEAKKIGKRAARLRKKVKRMETKLWRSNPGIRGLIQVADRLSSKKRVLTGKKRSRVPLVKPKPSLLSSLLARYNLGKRWRSIIKEMEQAGLIRVSSGMDLRAELARSLKKINPLVARAILKEEAVYFPHRRKISLRVFLRSGYIGRRKVKQAEQEPRWTMGW